MRMKSFPLIDIVSLSTELELEYVCVPANVAASISCMSSIISIQNENFLQKLTHSKKWIYKSPFLPPSLFLSLSADIKFISANSRSADIIIIIMIEMCFICR